MSNHEGTAPRSEAVAVGRPSLDRYMEFRIVMQLEVPMLKAMPKQLTVQVQRVMLQGHLYDGPAARCYHQAQGQAAPTHG